MMFPATCPPVAKESIVVRMTRVPTPAAGFVTLFHHVLREEAPEFGSPALLSPVIRIGSASCASCRLTDRLEGRGLHEFKRVGAAYSVVNDPSDQDSRQSGPERIGIDSTVHDQGCGGACGSQSQCCRVQAHLPIGEITDVLS